MVLRRVDGRMLLDVDVFKFVDEIVEIVEDGSGCVLLTLFSNMWKSQSIGIRHMIIWRLNTRMSINFNGLA